MDEYEEMERARREQAKRTAAMMARAAQQYHEAMKAAGPDEEYSDELSDEA